MAAGASHHYGKPRGPPGGPNRYPQGGNPSSGYNSNRGGQSGGGGGGGYNSTSYPPQVRGPPPYAGSSMPASAGPPRSGTASGYGVSAPNFSQGGSGPPYGGASGGGRAGANMISGNRNQQQFGGWQ